ncbi:MAG: hypothetical protein ACOY3P_05890 [Planctomycetota bacterium]
MARRTSESAGASRHFLGAQDPQHCNGRPAPEELPVAPFDAYLLQKRG